MSTDSLMPKRKSGGTGFIVAGVLMLLAMGGLIFWKVSSKQSQPMAVVSTTQAVAQTAPPELLEPPPPPPKEQPKPEATAEPDKKVASTKGGSFGCNAECNGKDPGSIRSALQGRAGQARGCYERALRNNSTLQGKLLVSVKIGPDGQVCSASIAENSLGDPAVATCVVQMFRSGGFPRPTGGCVDAAIPINFVPKT
jgi:outer membrane biosynthesis protein TonB